MGQTADGNPAGALFYLARFIHRAQIDDDIRPVDAVLDLLQQIRTAAGEGRNPAFGPRPGRGLHRIGDTARVVIAQRSHAVTSRSNLSRVIGKDRMRLPAAFATALATAAGARMIPDSPAVFAPKGP